MKQKIRYRLVYNYANRLTRRGVSTVALECRQGKKKIYLSSRVILTPDQWEKGYIVNHQNADKLMAILYRWKNSVEDIELESILQGKKMSLDDLRDALKNNVSHSATIREFVTGTILCDNERRESTKINYRSFVNEFEKAYGDKVTIEDITPSFIVRYKKDMKKHGLAENTIKGRLKTLRTIINEALKRDVIKEDPFKNITIGVMTPRSVYLTFDELSALESLKLKGRNAHVRDAFVWCCCVGLRFSDFTNLKDSDIVDGVLSITQQKTGGSLVVPLNHLFGGKPIQILSRYKSVRQFVNIGVNSYANKTIKELAKMAGIDKEISWHSSRHTAGTLLNQMGLKMQEIQKILGHTQMTTTANIYAVTTKEQVDASLKRAFDKRSE